MSPSPSRTFQSRRFFSWFKLFSPAWLPSSCNSLHESADGCFCFTVPGSFLRFLLPGKGFMGARTRLIHRQSPQSTPTSLYLSISLSPLAFCQRVTPSRSCRPCRLPEFVCPLSSFQAKRTWRRTSRGVAHRITLPPFKVQQRPRTSRALTATAPVRTPPGRFSRLISNSSALLVPCCNPARRSDPKNHRFNCRINNSLSMRKPANFEQRSRRRCC